MRHAGESERGDHGIERAHIVSAEVIHQVTGIGVEDGQSGVRALRAKVPDEVRIHLEGEQS